MYKKYVGLAVLVTGIASAAFAEEQLFFELNAGSYVFLGLGGRFGWIHYGDNEKFGVMAELSYYNNGFLDEETGDWKEYVKTAHNVGVALGVVLNNMGMNGVFRTSEYLKLKAVCSPVPVDELTFVSFLDLGFKLNVFFTDKTAFSAAVGIETLFKLLTFPYIALGMTFTL